MGASCAHFSRDVKRIHPPGRRPLFPDKSPAAAVAAALCQRFKAISRTLSGISCWSCQGATLLHASRHTAGSPRLEPGAGIRRVSGRHSTGPHEAPECGEKANGTGRGVYPDVLVSAWALSRCGPFAHLLFTDTPGRIGFYAFRCLRPALWQPRRFSRIGGALSFHHTFQFASSAVPSHADHRSLAHCHTTCPRLDSPNTVCER